MATFQELMRIAELTVKDKTSSKRMGEILSILKKHDVGRGISPEKAVAILEDLGPTYVKMGQIASNRSDLLPKDYCEAFEKLRAMLHLFPLLKSSKLSSAPTANLGTRYFRSLRKSL